MTVIILYDMCTMTYKKYAIDGWAKAAELAGDRGAGEPVNHCDFGHRLSHFTMPQKDFTVT